MSRLCCKNVKEDESALHPFLLRHKLYCLYKQPPQVTQCAEGIRGFKGHSSNLINAAEYLSGEASLAESAPVKYHTDNRSHGDRRGKHRATEGGMRHM